MFDKETYHELLCPVCGEFYFTKRNEGEEDLGYFTLLKDKLAVKFDVPTCHQCGWRYDQMQHDNPDSSQGENSMSLNSYKAQYEAKLAEDPEYSYLESQHVATPHKCPVCGKYEFTDEGSFDICTICGWEDDPVMTDDPDFDGGANDLCLRDFKARYDRLVQDIPNYQWEKHHFG